jgi:hypothetical protein
VLNCGFERSFCAFTAGGLTNSEIPLAEIRDCGRTVNILVRPKSSPRSNDDEWTTPERKKTDTLLGGFSSADAGLWSEKIAPCLATSL